MALMFRSVLQNDGGAAELIVTCDSEFAGATISCSDGTTTLNKTCPSSSPYEVTFKIPNSGDWTISATVSGTAYTSDPISVELDYTALLEYGFNWRRWVDTAQYLDSTDYSTLSDLLADEEALRELCLEHACVDYLCTSAVVNPVLTEVIGSDLFAKWVNNSDYALDKMYANAAIKTVMDTADKYGYGEWVITDDTTTPPTWGPKGNVPIMTSDSAPYGSVNYRLDQSGYNGYMAFSGNLFTPLGTSNHGYAAGDAGISHYIGYTFVNPIKVKKAYLNWSLINGATAQIQGSNDGSTWVDVSEVISMASSETSAEVDIDTDGKYYLQYQLKLLSGNWYYGYGIKMQYYGRELSVSVPTMTSNTTPFGEASASSFSHNNYAAWHAFGLDNCWYPSVIANNAVGQYLKYEFTSPMVVRQVRVSAAIEDGSGTASFVVEASNDNTNWDTLTDDIAMVFTAPYFAIASIDNQTPYKYVRIKLTAVQWSGSYKIGFYHGTNIYGEDYSEKEFEAGTTKKWLYDHGVELVDITYNGTDSRGNFASNDGDVIKINNPSTSEYSGCYCQLDCTPYSMMRVKIGKNCSVSSYLYGEYAIGYDATAPIYRWASMDGYTSYASNSAANPNAPNNISFDISNANQQVYLIITSGDGSTASGYNKHDFTEWWLE